MKPNDFCYEYFILFINAIFLGKNCNSINGINKFSATGAIFLYLLKYLSIEDNNRETE